MENSLNSKVDLSFEPSMAHLYCEYENDTPTQLLCTSFIRYCHGCWQYWPIPSLRVRPLGTIIKVAPSARLHLKESQKGHFSI